MTAIRALSAPLTLVLGKGGVGRSTVARVLTQAARDAGLRARCVELGPGSGRARSSAATPEVHSGERVLRIDPGQALEDAAAPVFGSRALARAALGNFAVKRLLDVLPGIHEYALLLSAVDLVGADLANPCERVIVDMPATGHGLSWLGAAQRFARLVPKGRSREQADRLDATLRDPLQTALVVTCVPEPLVLAETRELREELRAQLGRDADLLVFNRMPEVPAGAARAAQRLAADDTTLAPAARQLIAWLAAREDTRALAVTAAAGVPFISLPDSSGRKQPTTTDTPLGGWAAHQELS